MLQTGGLSIIAKKPVVRIVVLCVVAASLLVFVILLLLTPTRANAATDTAEAFIYPMRVWQLTTDQGDLLWNGTYHMGVDLGSELGVGAPVYAIGDGVVKEVRVRTKFGLVVLIEHTLPDGSRVTSLSGHLKPTDTPVKEGQSVKMGTRIGSLGDSSENGGWSPHLHFGIHKQGYSSTWIYYGHVKSKSTELSWHNPEAFISQRATKDTWNPSVALNLTSSSYVGSHLKFSVNAQDIGTGVSNVVVELSKDNRSTWSTIAQFGSNSSYPYRVTTELPDIDSGNSYIRVTAIDGKSNRAETMVRLTRDIKMSTSIGSAVLKLRGSAGLTHLTYQSGGIERSLNPFTQQTSRGGDIAVGDVNGDGENELLTMRSGLDPYVSIVNTDEASLGAFKAYPYRGQKEGRLAAGDVNGDGTDEIIVGFGPGSQKTVRIFNNTGTKLYEFEPFPFAVSQGVDVGAGDVNGDGVEEILVTMRAGKKKTQLAVLTAAGSRLALFNVIDKNYKSGANVSSGDVDNDGDDDILLGTKKYKKGTGQVIIIQDPLKQKSARRVSTIQPFGSKFSGEIDVTSQDNEGDGKDEIVVSQASNGEAWVKTYRFDDARSVLSTERVFEASHKKGARVAGWK
jgi:hypothetical protein